MSFINSKNGIRDLGIYGSLILILGIVGFVFFSPTFERNTPKVEMPEEIYWNLQKPIKIKLLDDSGILSYSVDFLDGDKQVKLDTKVVANTKNSLELEVLPPMVDDGFKARDGIIRVHAFDNSKWNWFRGNEVVAKSKVIVDRKSPIANVISNSYLLRQGGSGIIVAEINDENLKDFYVSFNDEELFEMFPFYKKGYYISIITWPIDIKEFKKVNIIAVDKANNKTVTKVPFYIKPFKEKVDQIKISEDFVNNISKHVLENSNMNVPNDIVEAFIKTNKELREKNVKMIREVVRKNLVNSANIPFDVKTFVRMTNAATFAQFGERRHYTYNDQEIDQAWHLGMDWASSKRAEVIVTNPGKVIFKDYLGIYGETIIIDHGWGLGSLYAHTSSQNVEVGDSVKTGDKIANTGATGAVFGDHLHFGMLVQGIEVNPNEWLDNDWIKVNLTKTINDSIKLIDGTKK